MKTSTSSRPIKKKRFPRSIRFIDTLLIISGKGEEEKQNSLYCPSKYESDVSIAQRELLLFSAYISYINIYFYIHIMDPYSPPFLGRSFLF